MPRAMWSGVIEFGLVSVPVKLEPATVNKAVRFHQLDAKTGERIRLKRMAGASDREVPRGEIVSGYEISKGHYVPLTSEELGSIAPERSHAIQVADFVELAQIDPRFFDESYVMLPPRDGKRAYALLAAALQETQKAGIARFVMRSREHLAAVRAVDGVLILETMHYPDEVRDLHELSNPQGAEPPKRELEMACRLIHSLAAEWNPSRYRDTYREEVLGLIERKRKGEEIVGESAPRLAPVTDLAAALEKSLQRAGSRSRPNGSKRRRSLEAMSRSELYERAAGKGIQGRSKMTKSDLIEALRRAS